MTPFGNPVVPEVNIIKQVDSGSGSAGKFPVTCSLSFQSVCIVTMPKGGTTGGKRYCGVVDPSVSVVGIEDQLKAWSEERGSTDILTLLKVALQVRLYVSSDL